MLWESSLITQLNRCFGIRTMNVEKLTPHCLCSEKELEYPTSEVGTTHVGSAIAWSREGVCVSKVARKDTVV